LEQQVKAHNLQGAIDLPGFVSNPFAFMRRAAALVLSSRYEGFGNVLVEALAVGTNVVSTDCKSGPAEILDHGRYGRLVPVGDPVALAAGIAATLEAPLAGEVLRRRAEDYGVSRIVARYLQALGLDTQDSTGPAEGTARGAGHG
jgi:glycosyltransferase involved in cell wall biosynthesis